MSTTRRPARTLLAVALVVNLIAAGAPGLALGGQPAKPPTTPGPRADAHEEATAAIVARSFADHWGASRRNGALSVRPAESAIEPAAWIDRRTPDVPAPRAGSMSTVLASTSGSGASPSNFAGRNHVWIPALGVDRSVSFFSCSSKAYPGDRVYRWGCAGGNNIYLFGHAHSVFKPLHDAYVRGRLAKGMKVYYADGGGKLSTYAVSWWKVTTADKGAWAYARQARPSLTLQTCVGAKSQYRLIVRLLKVG